MNAVVVETPKLIKLDVGCGPHKREGFTGIDQYQFEGVDLVANLNERWPIEDATVEEANLSHVLEHFSGTERPHVFNELQRVLIQGGKATITTPHWASNRAYGDYTHQWPAVSEMAYYYLNRSWRMANAPHTDSSKDPKGFDCDFDFTAGYTMHPELLPRNQAYQVHAMTFWKEACQDMICTITKR